MPRTAIIIGDGLAGALLAVLLARDGWAVRVYERRSDPRAAGYVGGRSINLALSARGLAGLREAGLEQTVMEMDAIPMPGRLIHAVDGTTSFQPYSKNPADAINSVSRGGLNLTLIKAAAAHPGISMVFDHLCVDANLAQGTAIFQRGDGSTVRDSADLLVGADGAFSALRGVMQKTDRFEYSQTYLGHGYKELHIPAVDGEPAMALNALHIWPRGGAMMIALPNRDMSFTCTLFWPWEGEHSFANLRTREDILPHFASFYGDAVPLMPTLVEDFERNPTSSLVTVRCWPWHREGKCVLVGDAAHAIVPFYGQGINCGFEDCVELVRCLKSYKDQREALEAYQTARKPNADAIADMALANFTEMRDLAGRPEWQYRKKIEQALHAAFPDKVEPQYNLVSFSTVPYVKAQESGRKLGMLVEAVACTLPQSEYSALGHHAWVQRVKEVAASLLDAPAARNFKSGRSDGNLIDISPTISSAIGVWPGDTAFSREVLLDKEKGDTVTLSTIRTTVHLGSHADASNHYANSSEGAVGMEVMPLTHYIGTCRVVRARRSKTEGSWRVESQDLENIEAIREARVLIATGSFPDPMRWNSDFAGLSVELVEMLASKGVITIGVDAPSVDLQDSKDLPAHRAIFRHGIAILEGLMLKGVEPGVYELFAQPLKLAGSDASPVRAVLRRY
ncbi:MAG TPA: FAD-dependent monooxygenase [Phycisphaerales bacterium]|nr:FAD-dependent monooxygenase [Phycisphaerales bacterium]